MPLESNRLEAITNEIHDMLSQRLTALMGDVAAIREIAEIIRSTESDIARRELLKDQLNARLERAKGPEREDLRRRIGSHDEHMANLTLLRADLTSALGAIAKELTAGAVS